MKMDGQPRRPVQVTCPGSSMVNQPQGAPVVWRQHADTTCLWVSPLNMRLSASCRRPPVWLGRLTHFSSSTRSHWLTPGCLPPSKWPQLNDPEVFLQKANFAAFLTPGSSQTWSPTRHSQLIRACSMVDYGSILHATPFSTFFFFKTAPLRKLISSSSPKPGSQFWGEDEKWQPRRLKDTPRWWGAEGQSAYSSGYHCVQSIQPIWDLFFPLCCA